MHFFTKINVLDISLGLNLPKLKVHTYVSSKNTKKLTDISFRTKCLMIEFSQFYNVLLSG